MNADLKRTIARWLRRVPFLYTIFVYVLNCVSPSFTNGVTGVIFNQQGHVLLLEHVFRLQYPWGLPGGWMGRREQPQEALQRELMEEIGLPIRVGPPLHIELNGPPRHLETGFLCQIQGEVAHLSNEILTARWFPLDELPELHRIDREMIRRGAVVRAAQSWWAE